MMCDLNCNFNQGWIKLSKLMVILFHNFKLNEVWDGDGIIY